MMYLNEEYLITTDLSVTLRKWNRKKYLNEQIKISNSKDTNLLMKIYQSILNQNQQIGRIGMGEAFAISFNLVYIRDYNQGNSFYFFLTKSFDSIFRNERCCSFINKFFRFSFLLISFFYISITFHDFYSLLVRRTILNELQ